MKQIVKNYFQRIFNSCTKGELVFWWILRLLMIYGILKSLIFGDEYLGSSQPLQMAANLVGMFAYEICQMLPKTSRMRYLSPRFQNITALGFFLGSFGGAFLNFYYIIPGYDKLLHALGAAEAAYIGYEYVAATQLKLKKTCPHQIATLSALGFSFIISSAWELFEFTYDQFFGGDAQHWNYQNALAAAGNDPDKIFHLFPVDNLMRFALMDTMGDIILNFIGAFIMYIILCFVPYRHRGKGDVNRIIQNEIDSQKTSVN